MRTKGTPATYDREALLDYFRAYMRAMIDSLIEEQKREPLKDERRVKRKEARP